ncbi:MAG: hypothetical protein WCF39_11490 [Pseudolabrys sp.]
MPGTTIQIHGRADSDFDCYLAMPEARGPVPAVVLASAIHGVDRDLRDLADEFAAQSPRRPICSGAQSPAPSPAPTANAPPNADSRGRKK